MKVDFHASAEPTLGVEWELGIVDRAGTLVPAGPGIIAELTPSAGASGDHPKGGVNPRFKEEFLTNTVELVTPVCHTVPDALGELDTMLTELRRVTDPRGLELMCAGLHPLARWQDQEVNDHPRYTELVEHTAFWGRQMLMWGVHVHVGITDRALVMPVLSGLLRYYPHLQAISASSPYWEGTDTGYASNRAMLYRQLNSAGLPYQFPDWDAFEHFVGSVAAAGMLHEVNELRWDLRPSPGFGTLENRIADGCPTLDEVGALAALTHCLVVDLADRVRAGETIEPLPEWFATENKWRSARFGLETEAIVDAAGTQRPLRDDLLALIDRLEPVAERLGCRDQLASVERILRVGPSYERQRRAAAAAGGDLTAVVRSLVTELHEGLPGE